MPRSLGKANLGVHVHHLKPLPTDWRIRLCCSWDITHSEWNNKNRHVIDFSYKPRFNLNCIRELLILFQEALRRALQVVRKKMAKHGSRDIIFWGYIPREGVSQIHPVKKKLVFKQNGEIISRSLLGTLKYCKIKKKDNYIQKYCDPACCLKSIACTAHQQEDQSTPLVPKLRRYECHWTFLGIFQQA